MTMPSMDGDSVAISGYVLRKVQRNDKWVRRWLQTHGHVLCSYNTSPRGEVQAKVLNALDLRKVKDIVLLETDATRSSFVIIPETDDESKDESNVHPGYVMRAESPEAAKNWADVLNRIRLLNDETEGKIPSQKAGETVCFCFKQSFEEGEGARRWQRAPSTLSLTDDNASSTPQTIITIKDIRCI